MKSPRDLAADIDPLYQQFRGMIRRFAISLTSKTRWQLTGFRQADGTIETKQAEVFSGIGFYARPPNSGVPEAIAGMVGDARVPVVVATRDEKTRAAVAGDVQPGETMMFSDQAVVYVKADGTIEARSASGNAHALATKADIDALANYISSTMILTVTGTAAGDLAITATASTPTVEPPAAAGTTKLKGE